MRLVNVLCNLKVKKDQANANSQLPQAIRRRGQGAFQLNTGLQPAWRSGQQILLKLTGAQAAANIKLCYEDRLHKGNTREAIYQAVSFNGPYKDI